MINIMFQLTVVTVLLASASTISKTGQIQSFDADGNVVISSIVKDDGYYQRGVTASFSRSGDIVTDNLTLLQWQDDTGAKTTERMWVTQDNYDAGNYNNTTGNTASSYCSDLRLGGYNDWRLPTIEELETIIHFGVAKPSLDTSVFQNYTSSIYWSSTTNANYNYTAWRVHFYNGSSKDDFKSDESNVRCVRAGE